MPEANELTIHIMAAMAQAERKAISKRTKEALAAAKASFFLGTKLGNPLGAKAFGAYKGNGAAIAAIKAKSSAFAADVMPIIDAIRADGHGSLRAIAKELNQRGIVTAPEGNWGASMGQGLAPGGTLIFGSSPEPIRGPLDDVLRVALPS